VYHNVISPFFDFDPSRPHLPYMKPSLSQQEFILTHENDDVRELALRYSREDIPFLLAQIEGLQIAKDKIPSWYSNNEIIYPAHLSLEQASSEMTAEYKKSLFAKRGEDPGDLMGKECLVDLTGGLGVDFSFLSACFRNAVYVEQNAELCEIAEHNFRILGLKNATVINERSEIFLSRMPEVDLAYLDPSRRDSAGRKVFRIEDCSPNVSEIRDLLLKKSSLLLIKYSPMLDISLAVATLGNVREVHIVSVENECKELLFILAGETGQCVYHAVNLKKNGEKDHFSFTLEEEKRDAVLTSQPGKYLYEPNASLLKAGAFNAVTKCYKVKKLHKSSHLYTSDEPVPGFPGRIFEIENVFVPNKKNIRQFVAETKKANITVRNFPMNVAQIRQKTGLKEGGDLYLFATTLAGEQKMWVVCRKFREIQ